MANSLNPSYNAVCSIKSSITTTLSTELPPGIRAGVIAPLLVQVNQWASQIPLMLESTASPTPSNIIFAIRKDLFLAPFYTQNSLGIASADLPTPFHDFLAFIVKLNEAQKSSKDKTPPKVRHIFQQSHISFYRLKLLFSSLPNALVAL
jgi:hypothetical protein